jgi:hypothetical protein
MRKTKVRIIGDPRLAGKLLNVIVEHFVTDQIRHFKKAPTRYSRSDSPGHTIYIDVVRPKEASE